MHILFQNADQHGNNTSLSYLGSYIYIYIYCSKQLEIDA